MASATTHHYQIVIVGADLAGVVFGALCAKRGYRVLLIGQGGGGALYKHRGHQLARRLELGVGLQAPAIKRVFDELSLGLELRNVPRPLEPAYQVVLPHARVDVSTNDKRRLRELQREFPGCDRDIATFFQRVAEIDADVAEVVALRPNLPPNGLIERFRFNRLVQRFPFLDDEWAIEDPLAHFPHGHPFRAVVHAPFRFQSGMLPARPYPATFVRAVTELWRGACTFEQGPDALRNLCRQIIEANAGDVQMGASVAQIEVKRRSARCVVLRDRRQVIGCDLLVCNMDPKRFCQMVPQEQQDEEFHHQIHTLQPVYYTFTGNFVVNARAIPEGMARHVFAVADPAAPLEEDNCLHIARDFDVGAVAEDRELRLVSAAMRVPLSAASAGAQSARELMARMRQRVEQTVPFLSEHLALAHTPWLSGDSDELDVGELRPCYGEAIAHTLGTSPLSTLTGYKNVLMGGDASFCGLGHDGPYLAALNLFAHTSELVKLKTGF